MNVYVTPYKLGSESAKVLARGLGALRTEGNKRYSKPSVFINWGKSSTVITGRGVMKVYNAPTSVGKAANKLTALTIMKANNVPVIPFTTSKDEALTWLDVDGVVYARSRLSASQGSGIILVTEDSYEMPSVSLYTKAIVKGAEYRVHIADNKVIDFTRKRRRDGGDANHYIKNSANGWVFCRQEEELPKQAEIAAIMAVASLGLDFGAVDVIVKDNKPYILEVNTAPGIEGTTLDKYIEYFKGVL